MSSPRSLRSNWHAVPGTNRARFVNVVTGENLSRRQYQKAIGKPLGPAKPSKHGNRMYWTAVRQEADASARSVKAVRSDPTFQAAWQHLRELWKAEGRGEVVDHSPGSDLAVTMEELGLRPSGATYDVGDTP